MSLWQLWKGKKAGNELSDLPENIRYHQRRSDSVLLQRRAPQNKAVPAARTEIRRANSNRR
jgi:hypothetical protein